MYALIDTGADDPVIGKSLASSLGLPVIRECEVTGATGIEEATIYLEQIYVPSLDVGMYHEMIALDLQMTDSRDYQALLGRTFLQYFKMEYDGMTGAVTLTKNPQHFSSEEKQVHPLSLIPAFSLIRHSSTLVIEDPSFSIILRFLAFLICAIPWRHPRAPAGAAAQRSRTLLGGAAAPSVLEAASRVKARDMPHAARPLCTFPQSVIPDLIRDPAAAPFAFVAAESLFSGRGHV